ncbi:MAG: FAD-dependent oxidoreductase, partial [Tepidanaerobacteraceae bacterium]|nr:FAD-dependent oxidoreductase [Tepidanaerobacteraceae bacterium]
GFIHRNTFISSPKFLKPTMEFKNEKDIYFAGQITGVEGYIESAASGIVAGINISRAIKGGCPLMFPPETVIGALCQYITTANPENFQPMKSNFGILSPLGRKASSRKERNMFLASRSLSAIDRVLTELRNN